jgi:Leucine rich repeat
MRKPNEATTSTIIMPHRIEDSTYLRPIPEDQSDTSSQHRSNAAVSSTFQLPLDSKKRKVKNNNGINEDEEEEDENDVDSSTGGVDSVMGKAGSILSNTSATVGGHSGDNHLIAGANRSVLADTCGDEVREEKIERAARCSRRSILLVTAAATLLVGVLSAILAVVVVNGRRNGTAEATDAIVRGTTNNSDATSPSPVAVPAFQPAPPSTPVNSYAGSGDPVEQLHAILEKVSDATLLYDDPNSSQYMARAWMVDQDTLLDTLLTQHPNRVLQRYSLVNFYYAMGGNFRTNSSGEQIAFLDPTRSECDWVGVTCDDTEWRRFRQRQRQRQLVDNTAMDPLTSENSTVFRLHFTQMNLEGTLPTELGAIPSIREVDLSNNTIVGTIPVSVLDSWQNLYWLDLSKNKLEGSIPGTVWTMPQLKYLFLSENHLSGKIVKSGDEISTTASFATLAPVDGTIVFPETLRQVTLFANKLHGSLPSWFSELYDLEHWIAFNNELTGSIPDPPPTYKLTHFDVSFNNITGKIPTSLWAENTSPPLQELFLDHNQLTGGLPDASLARPDMTKVWLHDNMLAGTIPPGFAEQWRNLLQLKILHNKLTGQLGPLVAAGDNMELFCRDVWPNYLATPDFDFTAECLQRTVSDNPPVRCDCCSLCVETQANRRNRLERRLNE